LCSFGKYGNVIHFNLKKLARFSLNEYDYYVRIPRKFSAARLIHSSASTRRKAGHSWSRRGEWHCGSPAIIPQERKGRLGESGYRWRPQRYGARLHRWSAWTHLHAENHRPPDTSDRAVSILLPCCPVPSRDKCLVFHARVFHARVLHARMLHARMLHARVCSLSSLKSQCKQPELSFNINISVYNDINIST